MTTLADEFREKITSIKDKNVKAEIERIQAKISAHIKFLNKSSETKSLLHAEATYIESTLSLVEWARAQGFNVHVIQRVMGDTLVEHVILHDQDLSTSHVDLKRARFIGVSV